MFPNEFSDHGTLHNYMYKTHPHAIQRDGNSPTEPILTWDESSVHMLQNALLIII